MNVLGITGRNRDAAAALAVDGRIVAAATEDSFVRVPGIGYRQTGGFPRASVLACLSAAGLESAAVNETVVVDEPGSAEPWQESTLNPIGGSRRTVSPTEADALQAMLSDSEVTAVLVGGARPGALAMFPWQADGLGPRVDIPGATGVLPLARTLASALGVDADDPFAALDRLSAGAEPEYGTEIGPAVGWSPDGSCVVPDEPALVAAIQRIGGDSVAALADPRSLVAKVQQERRALAASFMCELARLIAGVLDRFADMGARQVSLGGDLFANPRLNTELVQVVGPGLSFAAVPEPFGRALGALRAKPGAFEAGLALGPAFSEESIKRTLDNCRLDYVYEPDRPRLLRRVSRMLAQGKTIGWFQGPMAFGPRALGTRSILADPSHRYARQNLNEHLRQLPIDEPLPIVVAPSFAMRCFSTAPIPVPGIIDADVRVEWHQRLSAALDWRRAARVHGVSREQAPHLCDLLELHADLTGVPGLIELNLAGPGEPIACTPRDAVRTVYSSAIDALVIGRFLLMKDYWLLRTQET